MKEQAPNTIQVQAQRLELIAAVVLGILTLVAYGLQSYSFSEATTPAETALFNALQFLLTLGFTWFGTRAISKAQFEQSLRRFAIGAYRRVTDVQRMVRRLQGEISDMMADSPSSELSNLRVVQAIVHDTGQVVQSSIADWADVIGDELMALEKIRKLEGTKEEIESGEHEEESSETEERSIEEVEGQIEELIESLPPGLQLEVRTDALEKRRSEHAVHWLTRKHWEEDGTVFPCVTGDRYPNERNPAQFSHGDRVFVTRNRAGSLDVFDEDGRGVGRVQNITPLPYYEFADAIEACYGEGPWPFEFIEYRGGEDRDGVYYAWFRLRILCEPEDD